MVIKIRNGFGSGDAIGHRVTDAVLGKRVKVTDPAPSAASTTVATSCATPMAAFQEVYMLISFSFSFACYNTES